MVMEFFSLSNIVRNSVILLLPLFNICEYTFQFIPLLNAVLSIVSWHFSLKYQTILTLHTSLNGFIWYHHLRKHKFVVIVFLQIIMVNILNIHFDVMFTSITKTWCSRFSLYFILHSKPNQLIFFVIHIL